MLMPLLVTEISPARKARLLFGSSQEAAPGAITEYSSLAYSSASQVPCLLMARVLSSDSTVLPPWLQRSQWHQQFASPTAWPSANPTGWPFSLSALASFMNPSVLPGNLSNPLSFTQPDRQLSPWQVPPMGTPIQC